MGQMPIPAGKAAGKQKFEPFEPAGFANRLIAPRATLLTPRFWNPIQARVMAQTVNRREPPD